MTRKAWYTRHLAGKPQWSAVHQFPDGQRAALCGRVPPRTLLGIFTDTAIPAVASECQRCRVTQQRLEREER
jgi:hypothetical protein